MILTNKIVITGLEIIRETVQFLTMVSVTRGTDNTDSIKSLQWLVCNSYPLKKHLQKKIYARYVVVSGQRILADWMTDFL